MSTETETEVSASSTTRDPFSRMMLAATNINGNQHLQSTGIGRAASKVIGISIAVDSIKALGDTFLVPFFNTNSEQILKSAADKAKAYAAEPQNKEKMEAFRSQVVDKSKDSLSGVISGLQELVKNNADKLSMLGKPGEALVEMIAGFNIERALEQSKSVDSTQVKAAPAGATPATSAIAKDAARSAQREGRN